MSIIAKCDYCVLEGATYRRQTEIYDGILPDVMMCSNCGYAASFERERIVKLLEPLAKHDELCYDNGKLSCYFEDCQASSYQYAIELIKGEQK